MMHNLINNPCLKLLVGWFVVLRIYVALAIFQPYRDLKAGDNQSLQSQWRDRKSNLGPLALQAKSLTTTPHDYPDKSSYLFALKFGCTEISSCTVF